jgi:hypothetical protein
MTFDEYRIQTIEKLKGFGDAAEARVLLAEVDLVLGSSHISDRAQKTFWEALSNDLDVIAQEATLFVGKQAVEKLREVISAAQTAIRLYQEVLTRNAASP